jgi:hypothetical protein
MERDRANAAGEIADDNGRLSGNQYRIFKESTAMPIEQTRMAVTGRIWQAFAQSGVDTSAIPKEKLEHLVDTIADSVLLAMNDLLEEEGASERRTGDQPAAEESPSSDDAEEKVLWEGRPFLSISERYTVTTERVRIRRGLLSKDHEDIELIRIQDIDHSQQFTERMVNIGDVVLHSTDASIGEVRLRNVSDPDEVHEIIRRAMLDARRRYKVGFRQEV